MIELKIKFTEEHLQQYVDDMQQEIIRLEEECHKIRQENTELMQLIPDQNSFAKSQGDMLEGLHKKIEFIREKNKAPGEVVGELMQEIKAIDAVS